MWFEQAICQEFPERYCAMVVATTPDRHTLVARFQGDENEEKENEPTILVGTTGVLGAGVSLTRAFRIVLVEPSFMERDEQQAFARIRRIGQRNEQTYATRLVTLASPCEGRIRRRQYIRRRLQEPGEVVELSEEE